MRAVVFITMACESPRSASITTASVNGFSGADAARRRAGVRVFQVMGPPVFGWPRVSVYTREVSRVSRCRLIRSGLVGCFQHPAGPLSLVGSLLLRFFQRSLFLKPRAQRAVRLLVVGYSVTIL
jgi:hypothetical protein